MNAGTWPVGIGAIDDQQSPGQLGLINSLARNQRELIVLLLPGQNTLKQLLDTLINRVITHCVTNLNTIIYVVWDIGLPGGTDQNMITE
jgi:hypothetical protein